MTNTSLLARFAPALARSSYVGDGLPADDLALEKTGNSALYYIPFDYIVREARLVVVGISPGPTQLVAAYASAKSMLAANRNYSEILAEVKRRHAFEGMREKLSTMFNRYSLHEWLGLESSNDYFNTNLVYSTSIVPHAAFIGSKGLSSDSKFERHVLTDPIFRKSIERDFLPTIDLLSRSAQFIGLGPLVNDGLYWCVKHGYLQDSQLLGALPHPSGAGGSQVKAFIGQVSTKGLNPNDPVLRRFKSYDLYHERLSDSMGKLLGRPLTVPYPSSH